MPTIEQTEGIGIKLEKPLAAAINASLAAIGGAGAAGVPQAQFANQKRQEMEEAFKALQASQLTYIDKIPEMGRDTLQISDLIFAMPKELTPPTSIRIDKDMINYRWHTLRTSKVQKVTSGHSTARIYLSLYFVGISAINNGLRRLLATFSGLPFVYVENSFIRNNLAPKNDTQKRNMACSLVNIAVRTVPQTPNVLVADLTLLWFNYRPFATDFWFRKSWNSTLEVPKATQAVYNQEILKIAGGPQIPSEDDINITEPLPKSDPTAMFTPPTVLPQESFPLKQLVDSRLGEIMKAVNNRIEIKYREYKSISGLHGTTISVGKINKHLLRDVSSSFVRVGRRVLLRLHPEAAEDFEEIAKQFKKKFSKRNWNRRLSISSCFRDREMQRELQQRKPDLAAKGYSWHEAGLAVDINRIGMTRAEYKWLIFYAYNLGFKNLGVTNDKSPFFADGGKWNSSGDPNTVIIERPASEVKDEKGRYKDWETWHFDYKPVQKRALLGCNGNTQLTIKTLKGRIHYTSVGLDDKEIISETGSETSLDKVREREEAAETEIAKRLDSFFRDGWEVDPFGSDPVRMLLYKRMTFVVEENDTQLIPQGVTFAKSNTIAEIPIIGHEFSTQQYMGSTDLDATISFVAVGEAKLRRLQEVIELIQNNARIAKGIRDAAVIDITNTVLNFGGMNEAIVDKIDAASIPDMPGYYQVNLSLTQARRRKKKYLNQEKYLQIDAWKEATRWIVSNIIQTPKNIIKDLRYLVQRPLLETRASKDFRSNEELNEFVEVPQEEFDRLVPATPAIDERQTLVRSLELLTNESRRYVYGAENLTFGYSDNPDYADTWIGYLKGDNVSTTPIAEVLRDYALIMAEILSRPFPKEMLFRLGLEGLAGVVEEDTGNDTDDSDRDPRQLLKKYKSRLNHLWVRIYNEGLYLHPVFSNLYRQMFEIFQKFRRGSECYPDLDLPPSILTGSSLDTPPDYWFWNTSVEDNLFFNKKDIANTAAEHMANAYASMDQIYDSEWEDNYISPNKDRIRKNTTGSDGNFRTALAAYAYDESGRVASGIHTFPGEVVSQVFDYASEHSPPKLGGQTIQTGGNNEGAQIKPDEAFESQPITDGYSGRLVDMLDKSLQNFDGEVFRLARAYPTFKVYFMEEDMTDSGRLGIRNFDDFYSYSAIKDIRIVKSRKIPADLCVISITNIHGELDTLAYSSNDENASDRMTEKFDPLTVNTDQENPFSKLVVLEGSKIQVHLGYSNSPDELDKVFTGQVVEVGVSSISSDIIQLVCQSYGVELVAKLKTGGEYGTTAELLSSLICSEECIHFGRYTSSAIYDPAEVRSAETGPQPAGFAFYNKAKTWIQEDTLRGMNFLNKPQDDNIFTPEFGDYEDWTAKGLDFLNVTGLGQLAEGMGLINNDKKYYPLRTTIWDVFKEMELRHPGYIASAVPYGDRYTMFFGQPSHKYWSRPLGDIERGGWGFIESFLQSLQSRSMDHAAVEDLLRSQAEKPGAQTILADIPIQFPGRPTSGLKVPIKSAKDKLRDDPRTKDLKVTDLHGQETSYGVAYKQYSEYLKWLVKGRAERYKPFREYHFLSSENNIIANNIKASAHGTFNAVELTYLKSDVTHEGSVADATKRRQGIEAFAAKGQEEVLRAISSEGEQFKLKADDNIKEKDVRMMQALYTSCFDTFFARRYAVSLLMRNLRDVYKGTIVVTGNPKIKPYDVCVLFDSYRDIYGPVEVEQVTHIISQETGFITEIKPDLILTHNAVTTQCTMDAMVQSLSELYSSIADEIGDTEAGITVGTGAVVAGGAALGAGLLAGGVGFGLLALGGYKLVEFTTERQPLIITPVMNGIKPLIAGLDGYKRDDFWQSINGRWAKFGKEAAEGFADWWERSPITSWYHEALSDLIN